MRARTLVNRLSAAAAQVELIGERVGDQQLRMELAALHADVLAATRDACWIEDGVTPARDGSTVADLATLVRDATAPIARWLTRRETKLSMDEMAPNVRVALEPEVLRSVIASTIDALVSAARPGETLRIRHTSTPAVHVLRFELRATSAPVPAEALLSALSSAVALLQLDGGAASVTTEALTTTVCLELPASRASEP